MKPGLKKKWSILPACGKVKTASRFCMFSRVRSAGLTPGDVPVYVNVYDLTPANGYFYWAGLGIFHSGIEVHGVEYAFGAHDYPTSGVFEVEPRQCPGFKFRKSIFMGTTRLDQLQIREFMEHHAAFYKGNSYHLVFKNCNHFCKDVCYRLTGKSIPEWVNRLARIGSVCSCILPERFSAVRRGPAGYESCDSEKKMLRNAFGCMSSISMGHRQLSISSPFLSLPSKDSLVGER